MGNGISIVKEDDSSGAMAASYDSESDEVARRSSVSGRPGIASATRRVTNSDRASAIENGRDVLANVKDKLGMQEAADVAIEIPDRVAGIFPDI